MLRVAIGALALLQVAAAAADWQRTEAAIMGTRVQVEVWHQEPALAAAAVEVALGELRRIDRLMSPQRADSELSRINAGAAAGPVPVSAELVALIDRSLELSRLTRGAFDISFAAAGDLYDYRRGRRPDTASLRNARERIDYRAIDLDRGGARVGFATAGMALDLGGIAKGYAVESAARRVRAMGIAHALISAGGDTRVVGDRLGRPWLVGIRDPRGVGEVLTRTPLVDEAVSTSGDYERYFEAEGLRYHHIINPATGDSARALRSVTVIGPDTTLTDGLSTSVFVMGAQAGLALIDAWPGYEAVAVDVDGRLHYSAGLRPLHQGLASARAERR